jgi:hypothetical protein
MLLEVTFDPVQKLLFHFSILNFSPGSFLSLDALFDPSLKVLFRDLELLDSFLDPIAQSIPNNPHLFKHSKNLILSSSKRLLIFVDLFSVVLLIGNEVVKGRSSEVEPGALLSAAPWDVDVLEEQGLLRVFLLQILRLFHQTKILFVFSLG